MKTHLKTLDFTKIDNIVFDGIDHDDRPDYCDAYILSADYEGKPMDDEQIEELSEDRDFFYQRLFDFIR